METTEIIGMMKYKLFAPVAILVLVVILPCCCDAWISSSRSPTYAYAPTLSGRLSGNRKNSRNMIGTGFSFEDGEQILISVQKPFGIVLEQGRDEIDEDDRIVVTKVDPNGSAGNAGVREGDILVAVQNASTVSADLTEVLEFIANRCPRVVNLRFQRPK